MSVEGAQTSATSTTVSAWSRLRPLRQRDVRREERNLPDRARPRHVLHNDGVALVEREDRVRLRLGDVHEFEVDAERARRGAAAAGDSAPLDVTLDVVVAMAPQFGALNSASIVTVQAANAPVVAGFIPWRRAPPSARRAGKWRLPGSGTRSGVAAPQPEASGRIMICDAECEPAGRERICDVIMRARSSARSPPRSAAASATAPPRSAPRAEPPRLYLGSSGMSECLVTAELLERAADGPRLAR